MKQLLMAAVALIILFPACAKKENPGSAVRPFVIAFMPAKKSSAVNTLSDKISDYLNEKTGLKIKAVLPEDYSEVIDGFEQSSIDAAFINTFGYILAHYWGDADARLCLVFRSGHAYYQGRIAGAAGRVARPEDITGKKFAYTDPFSTAGFVLPHKFLQSRGIRPSETFFAGSYSAVVEGIYSGRYDAGAIYFDTPEKDGIPGDSRREIIGRYPDVAKKILLIASTGTIASSPVAFRKGIPNEITAKIIDALIMFADTAEGREALLGAYDAVSLARTGDNAYNGAREILRSAGLEAESLIPGGDKLIMKKKIDWLRRIQSDFN